MNLLESLCSAIIVSLGEDTPDEVKAEYIKFAEGALFMGFSWCDEDNEMMPILADYLRLKYNLYDCIITYCEDNNSTGEE